MFNSRQAWEEAFRPYDYKITECVDLLNDYTNFPLGNRGEYYSIDDITYNIPEMNYEGPLVRYDSYTNIFTFRIPPRNYEFELIGIKAVKPIQNNDQTLYKYFHFITFCDLAPSITKRVGFDSSNLNEGIEYMSLDQKQEINIWFQIPDSHEKYTIRTLSQMFNNLVIEFDLIVRKG